MKAGESRLALPLAALFVAFFVAPLCVLIVLSLHGEAAMRTWTFANYLKFFTDAFNYSILFETLLLGVKATCRLPCLRLSDRLGLRACRRPAAEHHRVPGDHADPDQRGGAHFCLDRHPGPPGGAQPDLARARRQQSR